MHAPADKCGIIHLDFCVWGGGGEGELDGWVECIWVGESNFEESLCVYRVCVCVCMCVHMRKRIQT